MSDVLNRHAALGRPHKHGTTEGAVHEDGKVLFSGDLKKFRNKHSIARLSRFASLLRYQCLPNHLAGNIGSLLRVGDNLDAALEPVLLEVAHPATTSEDLRLDHHLAGLVPSEAAG